MHGTTIKIYSFIFSVFYMFCNLSNIGYRGRSFMCPPSTAGLLHRKRASVGASRETNHVQDKDKRKAMYVRKKCYSPHKHNLW